MRFQANGCGSAAKTLSTDRGTPQGWPARPPATGNWREHKHHLAAVQDGVLPLAQGLAGAFADQNRLFPLSSLLFVAQNFGEAETLMNLAKRRP
tara:strand:+ start:142 stop:423 length:282 start_codon:yes stop_codon:yes gene_type:complete